MHSVKTISWAVLCTFLFGYTWGQKSHPISIGNTTIVPGSNITSFSVKDDVWQQQIYGERLYGLLQFNEIPDQATHAKLRLSDIQLLDYLPQNTYLASLPQSISEDVLGLYRIQTILPVQANWKLSKTLENGSFPTEIVKGNKIDLLILIQKDINKATVFTELSRYGEVIHPRFALQSSQTIYFRSSS